MICYCYLYVRVDIFPAIDDASAVSPVQRAC